MRIGLLAPQFPPAVGGMQELALGFALGLSRHDTVIVYTLPEHGVADAPFAQRRVLVKKNLTANLEVLRAEEANVDVWCAMTAGLAPLARFARHPFFAYFHGNDFLSPGYGFVREWSESLVGKPLVWRYARAARRIERHRLMRRSLPALREVFTNSHSTAALIDRTFPAHGRAVTVIPPGVADAFFQQSTSEGSDALRLLTISRLTTQARRKNIDGLLHALQLLRRQLSGLKFTCTIIGEGNDRGRLESLAATLGLQDRVTFTGFVTREELLAALRRADLFVLAPKASAYDVEGFGMVYIEASASGVPVLGSIEGGAVDAIESGTNGILIDVSAPEAIAEGIRRFAAERHRFPRQQVQTFAERFRWREVSGRLRARIASHLGVTKSLSG
jgi:glycosyltransferase involved in cell wall biosynthesis